MMDQLQKRYSGCGLTCLLTTNMWSWFGVGGGEGGYSCWDGWESGWMVLGGQVQSQLLQQCCKSFVKASYLVRTRHAHQVTAVALHILQQSAFLSCVEFEPDHTVSSKQWQTQMETELPQFKYWALVLNFQYCVLRLVCWVRCSDYQVWNVCPGILLWTMWTMRRQTFSSLSFFCCGAFFVWKTK